MKQTMKSLAVLTTFAAILSAVLYNGLKIGVFLTLAITFGTAAYHFCIRLFIGTLLPRAMKKPADYTKKWYQQRPWEQTLYAKLGVKKWKRNMPTYNPELFDISKHSFEEIAQAMCQAELVHEVNIVFSFVPVVCTVWFGAFAVFLVTSLLSAAYDLLFVMMQRYNRPRILRIINHERK